MMDAHDNYMAFLNHEPVDWIPVFGVDNTLFGGQFEYWENGPMEGGLDGFGNGWIPTESAGGQPALDPANIPLDDVCDWEDVVKFPDLDAIDWQKYSDEQYGIWKPNGRVIEYYTWNSVFLRFTHLLGFENALCAFYEEPEASKALCDAIADYKCRLLERVAEYIHPETYVHLDDVATERSLFMSPDIYREFIKPGHIKMNECAKSLGMLPIIHICGKCEAIIPDIIEEGSVCWQVAQPSNDIAGIIEKYGDKLSIMGGYDTQGAPGATDASDEVTIAEVHRCLDEYGKFGHSYGFMGFKLKKMIDPVMTNEAVKYGHELIEKIKAEKSE